MAAMGLHGAVFKAPAGMELGQPQLSAGGNLCSVAHGVAKVVAVEKASLGVAYTSSSVFGGQHAPAVDAFGTAQHGSVAFHTLLERATSPASSSNGELVNGTAGNVLIPGGTGALGSLVARFTALQSKQLGSSSPQLWLLGRRTHFSEPWFSKMRGSVISVVACDLSATADMEGLGESLGAHNPELSIHHTAGVLTVSGGCSSSCHIRFFIRN